MLFVVKVFKIIAPLIKEYLISNLRINTKDGRSMLTTITVFLIGWLSVLIFYIGEQAHNNLTLHKPLIEQYKTNYNEKLALKRELDDSKNKLATCEAYGAKLYSQCHTPQVPGNLVYDPVKGIMVEK